MSNDEALLFCNDAFYQAFLDKDYPAMEKVWAAHAPLLCIHPGSSPLHLRSEVMESWRQILQHESAQPIVYSVNTLVHYEGISLITCYEWDERQPANRLLATNGFVKEDGEYRMVMHQAGPTAGPVSQSRPQTDKPQQHAVH